MNGIFNNGIYHYRFISYGYKNVIHKKNVMTVVYYDIRNFQIILLTVWWVNSPEIIYATMFCKSFCRDWVRTGVRLLQIEKISRYGRIDHLWLINPLQNQYKS